MREPDDHESPSLDRQHELVDAAWEQAGCVHQQRNFVPGVDVPALPGPDSIPGYQILREIHRGGQGVVYQAIQGSTKRKVAIKVMREGPFASRADKARFDREVQILGALNHPHIVTIHDSGRASGSFYFVMDYIAGQPLDLCVASREHSIIETLRLFAKICEAVNAAHLRGVIHRDLKPSNIRIDAEGAPHVLDFGLAKMAVVSTTDDSAPEVMTITGQFVGSLPWASPEQAEAIPDRIDTRTDVYSLGVVLYQMLTGRFPYDVVGSMRDVLDNIIKAEPIRPSTVRRQIDDEVETIVLKCLSKERERRYQTAGELARDVHHYLAGEPIEAKRDSTLYVLRKTLGRYRSAALVVVVLFAVITAASVSSLVLWRRAQWALLGEQAQRQVAQRKTREAQDFADQAEEARNQAISEKDKAWASLYSALILEVDKAISEDRFAPALELLFNCPEQYRNWEWGWLLQCTGLDLMTFNAHKDGARSIDFSPDDRWLVSSGADALIAIWDLKTGGKTRTLRGHLESVNTVEFSPDGRLIASGSGAEQSTRDNTVRIWDVASGQEKIRLTGHSARVLCVAFSPDGKRLASASGDGTAKVWNLSDGTEAFTLWALSRRKGDVRSVCWSRQGDYLATAGWEGDCTARIWDGTMGTEIQRLTPDKWANACVAFNPTGALLATGGKSGCVRIYQVSHEVLKSPSAQKPIHAVTAAPSHVQSLAFSPNGSRLAVSSISATGLLMSVPELTPTAMLRGHESSINCVRFSKDGQQVATASWDGTVKLWSNPPVESFNAFAVRQQGEWPYVEAMDINGDGSRVVTAVSQDVFARVWDTNTGLEVLRVGPHIDQVGGVAFSPDGQFLATVQAGTRIWDLGTGACRRIGTGYYDVAFSPDGSLIAACASQDQALVWVVQSGQQRYALDGHTGKVVHLAFSKDGKVLATAGEDRMVCIWDLESGSRVLQFRPTNNKLGQLSFSPDGRLLAIGHEGNSPVLWDLRTDELAFVAKGHKRKTAAIAFSPDGTRIVTASLDGSIRIWDTGTHREVGNLICPAFIGYVVKFSSDGMRIVASGRYGQAAGFGGLTAWPWWKKGIPPQENKAHFEQYKRVFRAEEQERRSHMPASVRRYRLDLPTEEAAVVR